ncbi:MAG: vanadium-dependent haloperoxidase [Chitinophagales bacterium]|nr:vanadium-dependent haloperoxidase [Chitinophagales bacterium]
MKIFFSFLLILSLRNVNAQPVKHDFSPDIRPNVFAVTMVMVHDVVDPALASRYYAYCVLGADAIVSKFDPAVPDPSSYIKSFPAINIKEDKNNYNYQLAAVYSILETGKNMLPSGYMLEDRQTDYINKLLKEKISKSLIERSVAVAKEVSRQIIDYSNSDNYNKLSTLVNYTPLKGDQYWYPTPPGYFEAVQPHWTTIRPMIMDSSQQFKPEPPVIFSKDSGSEFYSLAKEVYDALKSKDSVERSEIAYFWDCNPFNLETQGHLMMGFKKITPGGHWMNIASIASEKVKLDFNRSIQVQVVTSIALMDAFISCWDEKYRSNRIRPETYINRYIDKNWTPILQTPPFPEYTSGHSIISAAASEVLTYFFGDNFSFTDSTEVAFGLQPRNFKSFRLASEEAAISRQYGGIHFHDSIVNGQISGRGIGKLVIEKIKAAGMKPVL